MSIFAAFHLLFEADSKGLEASLKGAEKQVKDLGKSVKEVEDATSSASAKMMDLASSLGKVAATYISIQAVRAAVDTFTQGADSVGRLSEALGLNIEEVGTWQGVIGHSGGSVDSFNGTLKSMSEQLYQAKRFGFSELTATMSMMGMSATKASGEMKTAFEVLPDIAEYLERTTKAMTDQGKAERYLEVGRKLGLDESTVAVLKKGSIALREQLEAQKALGNYTKDDYALAQRRTAAIHDMGKAYDALTAILARAVIPVLEWFDVALTNTAVFLREHENFLKALGVTILGAVIPTILTMGLSAVAASGGFAVLAANVLAATWPFIAIGAAILLVAAVIDDVVTYIEGGDSVLGRWVEKWPALGQALRDVGEIFKWLWNTIAEFFSSIDTQTGAIPDAFKAAFKVVGAIIDAFISFYKAVFEGFFEGIHKVAEFLGVGGDKPAGKDAAAGQAQQAKTPAEHAQTAVNAIGATNVPISAITNNTAAQSSRTQSKKVSIGKVTVNTQATDAAGVAQAIGQTLSEQMSSAMDEWSQGVAA